MTMEDLTEQRRNHLNTIGGPFGIILNPSGDIVAMAGGTCTLSVTLINEGGSTPLVNVMIDETSQPVRQWCLNPEQRLALGDRQSSEVIFTIQLPLNIAPGYYDYVLVIDAPDHYPENTPILIDGRIQVQPYVQEVHLASDPTFLIQPSTSAIQPVPLQPGQSLDVLVVVQNRSDRVDRFRLVCPDLDPAWYEIEYEDGVSVGGIITSETSLELNPNDQGEIRLIITPPLDTKAGVYAPTIYIRSANQPDLALLDVIYFRVLPVYLLTTELVVIVGNISKLNGQYVLFLSNEGNTDRTIRTQISSVKDEAVCTFTVSPEQVFLPPGGSAAIALEVEPKYRWKQPFYGRVIDFTLELEDLNQHPLLNDRFAGTLVWDGRPWWQFLLVILTGLGLLGILIFAIWLMLPRPPRSPEILDFYPQRNYYSEADNKAVRLNWQIANPERLMTIQVEGASPDGLILSRAVTYDFTAGIPEALTDYCTLQEVLLCANVPTDARKAGDYIFELTATPIPQQRRSLLSRIWRTTLQAAKEQTSVVRVTGIPIPRVTQFGATATNYTAIARPTDPPETETPDPPADSPLNFRTPIFSIQPPRSANGDPNVIVNPPEPATPAADPPNQPDDPPPPFDGILLNWSITDPRYIQELRLVGRDADGVPVTDTITYDFREGIPAALTDVCGFTNPPADPTVPNQPVSPQLVCQAVPTDVRAPGTYTFELTVIATQPTPEPPPPTVTEPIQVLAAPITINTFTINGEEALPKYVLALRAGQPILLTIGWEVIGSEDIAVELLPSPGSVPNVGAISYPLSQEPGTEVITLQATNAAGDEVSRTVTIEKTLIEAAPGGLPEGLPEVPGAPPAGAPPAGAPPAVPPGNAPATPPSDEAPPLPTPRTGSPPVPPGRNAPPPSELPPTLY
jgi:hypothetical protein